eukprot:c17484_g1_i1.p1 GENE.c17484_g1_i1~~c17484_g1_i1.p1  ORF type:complete len:752 (+),score=216.87 c17484_g1_i1:29-2284(+)
MKTLVVLCVAFLGLCIADDHILTYVGYDHLVHYNAATGALRAFDFHRRLPDNDTCDFFVFPPLIESTKFIDVMTMASPPEKLFINYMGAEMFLVQDSVTGGYTIRKCSGFMPQQTKLPCEVWTVGHDPSFKEPNRFFFAGDNRVIRYNSHTRAFDLLWFDTDIHGGGFPFGSKPVLTGQFGAFPDDATVGFAVVHLNKPSMDLILAHDETAGTFKVWQFKKSAKSIEGLIGQLVLTGTLLPHYQIKTLGENQVVAYDRRTGDYEVWRFEIDSGRVQLKVVKSDSLESGHGCIHHDRQTCIAHKTCGWCADSITCHQLNSQRLPCDGTKCMSIIDEFSPASKKFQRYEIPIASALKEFGDKPADNPVSPLRKLSETGASPILRDNDLADESILEGVKTNPSEGIVFVPPRSSNVPCMDSEYQDPRTLPPPDLKAAENNMNLFDGAYVKPEILSPLGDAKHQHDDSGCVDVVTNGLRNVTKPSSPAANATYPPVPGSDALASVPEIPLDSATEEFIPMHLGTAMEEDLMNAVRSHYSSLMPKGNNLRTDRPEANDPPAPPTEEMLNEMKFHPKDPNYRKLSRTMQPHMLIPEIEPYTSSQMETGVPQNSHVATDVMASSPVQYKAMANAQFQSSSIYSPPIASPSRVTREHSNDLTGTDRNKEGVLEPREDEPIVEGWEVKDVHLDVAQVKIGVSDGVPGPEPEVSTTDLQAQATEEKREELVAEMHKLEALAKEQGVELPPELPIALTAPLS